MRRSTLIVRGLRHYWRTNIAVVVGVGTAVAVLAGALLVGDSVRGSLRDLVLQRLGRTDRIVVSTGFFREALAGDLQGDPAFSTAYNGTSPLIVAPGLVTDQESGRRASRVQVYGVDDRFWRFHDIEGRKGPDARGAFISRALAHDIGASAGGTVLVRVERPTAIPLESLHGRKDDLGRTLRLTVREIIGPSELGDFSLRPQQGEVRAVFVPLRRLQLDLQQDGRVNTLLVSDRVTEPVHPAPSAGDGGLQALLKRHARLEDFGLTLRALEPQRSLAVESAAGLMDDRRAAVVDKAAADLGFRTQPVFTYLANSLRSGERQVPYSLVTATDLRSIAGSLPAQRSKVPPIVLNDWTARELAVAVGDPLTLEYFVWQDPGLLQTRTADFEVAAIVPIAGAAADRDLAPVYPGITQAERLGDWDPPFPIDLRRVRPIDEDYWKTYRTTPKAFIPFDVGQGLWRSRYGDRTSVRILPDAARSLGESEAGYRMAMQSALDPFSLGFSVHPVRAEGLAASRGATDFGEYFTYFSFFLVASALVLAALFFRLGVEQRAREVGLLRAVGFTTARVRRLFTGEGLLLAAIGSVLGVAGALAYGGAMMAGLRTWWSGAVGTSSLTLHVSPWSLAAGAVGALMAAMVCIWWTLRGLARLSERSLLAGNLSGDDIATRRGSASSILLGGAVALAGAAGALILATRWGAVARSAAFFGAGASILMASLCALAYRLRAGKTRAIERAGWWPVARLGARNTSGRPGRSVLAIAVIASATFILISVDAFRRGVPVTTDPHSGGGGYPLLVDLLVPLVHDPNGPSGREALGLSEADRASIVPFRVLPGDEASCLNLYEPRSPRVFGVGQRFIESGRFSFQAALASNDAERTNPWLILNRHLDGDAVPVIADANSMTYVLHRQLGDEIVIARGDRPVRLRLVAALSDSIFQGELLMSEAHFIELFPEQHGYRFLLVDTPLDRAAQVSAAIENGAADLGADAEPTAQRLAQFHTVENTYLSTFQTLGGLGLLVGTVGLAAVLLRNVLERRRELALLRAVGYGPAHLFAMVLSENVTLLVTGLLVGTVSALIAIAPAAAERGAHLPLTWNGSLLLLAVFAAGLVSSTIATRAALGGSLVGALRSE